LQRHGLPPAPERKRTTTWAAFIRTHLALLAGTDFGAASDWVSFCAITIKRRRDRALSTEARRFDFYP
jgi:hypothetical protein